MVPTIIASPKIGAEIVAKPKQLRSVLSRSPDLPVLGSSAVCSLMLPTVTSVAQQENSNHDSRYIHDSNNSKRIQCYGLAFNNLQCLTRPIASRASNTKEIPTVAQRQNSQAPYPPPGRARSNSIPHNTQPGDQHARCGHSGTASPQNRHRRQSHVRFRRGR